MTTRSGQSSYLAQYRPELSRYRTDDFSDGDTSEIGIRERRKLRAAPLSRHPPRTRPPPWVYPVPQFQARPTAPSTMWSDARSFYPPKRVASDTASSYETVSTRSSYLSQPPSVVSAETSSQDSAAAPPPPPPPPLDPVGADLQEKRFDLPCTVYYFKNCKHKEVVGIDKEDGKKPRHVIRGDACVACIAAREAARLSKTTYETKIRKGDTGSLKYIRTRK